MECILHIEVSRREYRGEGIVYFLRFVVSQNRRLRSRRHSVRSFVVCS